jgi:ABC-type multidrug transport system fused ATPase/permease subunit
MQAPWKSKPSKKPPQQWPAEGEVIFSDYATRYRPGLDLVLKGIDAAIAPGEKIGIVGRTGAGMEVYLKTCFQHIYT